MDQLFLMKRYWASDEEDSTEEKSNSKFNLSESKVSSKKLKLDLPISNEEIEKYSLYNGKEKSQPSVIEINSENDSEEDDIVDNELKSDSSLNDSNVNILDATGDFIPCESIKTKTHENIINTSNKIISKVVKNPKKSQQNNITSTPEKYGVMVNGSNLTKNINKITGLKEGDSKIKTKKETLKHSELLEDNKLKSPNHTATLENKTGNVNVKNRAKSKKIRTPELEESIKKTDPQEHDSNSQKAENIGQVFSTIGQKYQQKHDIVKHALPQWLCNPTYISVNLQEEETPISKLNYLDINTKRNLQNAGINFLFPVQQAVIPWLMQSKEQSLLIRPSDICVSAPTGSGKTFAFVLPIVQSLKDRIVCAIRALIVLPVSELAIQVFKVFETFIAGTDLKVALLTGKKSFVAEQNALVKSDGLFVQSLVDIVVTTPGRINDHIYRTKGFCLKRLRYLVIDEADRMMEEIQEGWLKQVEDSVFRDCIFSNCVCSSYKRTFYEPTSAHNFGFISQPLQKLLYSATLTHDPEQLHNLSLYKPKLFAASSVCAVKEHKGMSTIPPGLKMLKVICEEGIKPMIICHLVKHYSFKRVLCFTETVERAHRLHLVLEEMGLLQVREISSFNRAIQRKIVLEQFTFGKINVLVCSDLVARGIDVKNIDCVISYDLPQHVKTYIHRIGRTARAGKTGTAITFLSEAEEPIFKKMLSPAGIKEPEKVYVNSEDLKPFIHSYQKALSVADVKLKKEKNQLSNRQSKKD